MIQIEILTPDAAVRLRTLADQSALSKDFSYLEQCLQVGPDVRRVLIATHNGQDCGFCVLNFDPIYPAFRRLEIPEIQDLNVIPAFRRQGVGAALVGACEDAARGAGRDMIGIGVGLTSSYGAAQRLYARLGYIPDGAGAYYNGTPVRHGELKPIDDDLNLYMVKTIRPSPLVGEGGERMRTG